MLAKVTDHAGRALGRMLTQFRESAQFKGILNSITSEVQALEEALYGLLVVRDIDNATGATLDKIARLVGAPDRSFALSGLDANFRKMIKLQIIVNKSTGTDADLYAIIAFITTVSGGVFKVRHGCPATFTLGDAGDPTGEAPHTSTAEVVSIVDLAQGTGIEVVNSITADDASYFAHLFASAAPVGSRVIFQFRPLACTLAFRFAGVATADRGGFGSGRMFDSKDK